MSKWITDRLPTREDCVSSERTLYEDFVWTMVAGSVVTDNWYNIKAGIAWQPIVIERPEPYVSPRSRPKYFVMKDMFYKGLWAVYDGGKYVTGRMPTQEAAERFADLYNEVMP